MPIAMPALEGRCDSDAGVTMLEVKCWIGTWTRAQTNAYSFARTSTRRDKLLNFYKRDVSERVEEGCR